MLMSFTGPKRGDKSEKGMIRSLWSSLTRRPAYPAYMKSSDLRAVPPVITSPIICCPTCQHPTSDQLQLQQLPPRPVSAPPRPARPAPLIMPMRNTSSAPTTPLVVSKHTANSLYALKSFSTTHLSLGPMSTPKTLPSSSSTSAFGDILHFPTPPRRPARPPTPKPPSPAQWFSRDSMTSSSIPISAPRLAALDLFEPFSLLPGLPSPTPSSAESTKRLIPSPSIPEIIMESPEPEEVCDLEYALTLRPTSTYTSIPIPMSRLRAAVRDRHEVDLSPEDAEAAAYLAEQWRRNGNRDSIALSCSSLLSDLEDSGDQEDSASDAAVSDSDSSSSLGCLTPAGSPGAEETALSPWSVPVQQRRKGSVVFPSRASASCVSLGKF